MSHVPDAPVYRPDIDGLRAIAVVPVVLFHAGVAPFSGGFVGVDIFFVISGYLITALIARQAFERRFSFVDFYARRIRRLFPALWAAMAFTLAAGFFLLLPAELADLGLATQRVALFVSNHLFWHTRNDYWAQNALSTQPLLHTWSLAVEEQFYVVLPVLLVAAGAVAGRLGWRDPARIARHAAGALLVIALASFAFGQWLLARDTAGAFYLLAARAWELLLGSLLALHAGRAPGRSASAGMRHALGVAGLALIAWSVFRYTEETPFPGLAALAPCAGAALLIWAGMPRAGMGASLATRLLSSPPLVFVGLISYSLYLWHWPVLVFARSVGWHARGLPTLSTAGLLAVIAAVSYLSYRLVEQPFRRHGPQGGRRLPAYCAALAALPLLFLLGRGAILAGKNEGPVRQPIPPIVQALIQDTETTPGSACEGSADPAETRRSGGGCRLGLPASADQPLSFVLLGDSHARMWTAGLDRIAAARGRSGLGLTRSSCTPLVGIVPPTRSACTALTDASLDYIVQSPIHTVILAGYWTDLAETARAMVDEPGSAARPADPETLFGESLARTLARLQQAGKQVYILLDVPELADDRTPALAAVESLRQDTPVYGPTAAAHRLRQARIEQAIDRLRARYSFTVLDPARALCGPLGCLVAHDGRTLYRDKHHLTDRGAREFASVFEPVFP